MGVAADFCPPVEAQPMIRTMASIVAPVRIFVIIFSLPMAWEAETTGFGSIIKGQNIEPAAFSIFGSSPLT